MKRLTFFTALLFTLTLNAFEFTGKVVGVADGDTITVLYGGKKQYKVRLTHIDCPESTQAFGTKAKQALSEKVFSKTVTVKWEEMDRYKRILGDVYIDKRWINLEMVNDGLAWHYKYYSKDASMAAAETKARTAKLGIWSEPNPTAPWDFRKGEGLSPVKVDAKGNAIVYVTKTGRSYHVDGCRYLAKSKIAATGIQVANRYSPCTTCKPPAFKLPVTATRPATGNNTRPQNPRPTTRPQTNPRPVTPSPAGLNAVVFTTNSGSKYHRAGCRYLAKSKIQIALANARKRYGPCKVCKPPQ